MRKWDIKKWKLNLGGSKSVDSNKERRYPERKD
jgi:hypothetical protein